MNDRGKRENRGLGRQDVRAMVQKLELQRRGRGRGRERGRRARRRKRRLREGGLPARHQIRGSCSACGLVAGALECVGVGVDEDAGVDDVDVVDIPFEFVGEIAGSGTVAEAGHVESLAAARHSRVEGGQAN